MTSCELPQGGLDSGTTIKRTNAGTLPPRTALQRPQFPACD